MAMRVWPNTGALHTPGCLPPSLLPVRFACSPASRRACGRTAVDEEGHMAYLPAGISVEELLTAAEDLQAMLPTPMASRPSEWGWRRMAVHAGS